MTLETLERHELDAEHDFYVGRLPAELLLDHAGFEELWSIHPAEYDDIQMFGRWVKTPHWQQAYGRDYYFAGRVNAALPMVPKLEPFLCWGRKFIDIRLNGVLVNWYDGQLRHYIGPHHDETKDLVVGSPIVTISLGEERLFRLTRPEARVRRDFPATDGTVFVMPWDTNRAWKHQMVKSTRWKGRRISITLRVFED